MPPAEKLTGIIISDFVKWIEMGAPDPRDKPPSADETVEFSWKSFLNQRSQWWSLQPVVAIDPPPKHADNASDHPIDRFISAKQRDAGVQFATSADATVLLRRLSLVLTGLPPKPAEIEQFANDHAREPDAAYDRLVERLLDSPHFGEHWARHWMDVVRFAETHGYEWNHEIRDAWQYRDYLIRAFNADVPYDQFVREHIAGDLLAKPRVNAELGVNESRISTAFWRFGELGHDDCVQFPEIRFDAIDNQIDTFSKAFQGLTISCARCHDHKLDAISTKDYYALVGVLESCSQVVHTIDSPQRIADATHRIDQLKKQIRQRLGEKWLVAIDNLDEVILDAMTNASTDGSEASPLAKHLSNEKIPREDPGYVLRQFIVSAGGKEFHQQWQELKKEYADEQTRRVASNTTNFEVWSDFQEQGLSGWSTDGLGLSGGPTRSGEFLLTHEGDQVVAAILPAGLYTNITSDRLNGSLRSPWLSGDHKFVSLQLVGNGQSMVRAVVDSCGLNEFAGGGLEYLDGGATKWKSFPTSAGKPHRSFIELTTKSDNPRWPDRPGRAGTNDKAKLNSPRSSFGVMRAVLHDSPGEPAPDLSTVLALFKESDPKDPSQLAKTFQEIARTSLQSWQNDKTSDADVEWINWLLKLGLLPNSATDDPLLTELLTEYRAAESAIPEAQVVAGLADRGNGFDFPVLQGGDSLHPGTVVPRRDIEVLGGLDHAFSSTGSGRRQLAELVSSSTNPLTARVMVNRVWHHLFGSGIVATTDDFGHMGELPTHPELLDALASRFISSGWSTKQLIRFIVTSQTFRQSSVSGATARDLDPDNSLLHHYPARRMSAETIRDTILAVSGRLDPTLYGKSIHPHRSAEIDYRKLLIGPLDGNGRRSIYTKVTRMEGPQFLELFDMPAPMASRGRRDRTNVPAQALALLNDPFVIDQARFWAEQLVAEDDRSVEQRVDRMFLTAVGRQATELEQQRFVALVQQLAGGQTGDAGGILKDQSVWQDAAHAMFNMKEVIYIR